MIWDQERSLKNTISTWDQSTRSLSSMRIGGSLPVRMTRRWGYGISIFPYQSNSSRILLCIRCQLLDYTQMVSTNSLTVSSSSKSRSWNWFGLSALAAGKWMAATSLDNQIVLFGADTFKQNVSSPPSLLPLLHSLIPRFTTYSARNVLPVTRLQDTLVNPVSPQMVDTLVQEMELVIWCFGISKLVGSFRGSRRLIQKSSLVMLGYLMNLYVSTLTSFSREETWSWRGWCVCAK